MPFQFQPCAIPEVLLIESKVFKDDRGAFSEMYRMSDFIEAGVDRPLQQVNLSRSTKGVLRGLHYQLNPRAMGKLIQVVEGEIFDVAVDIRKGSPTYGKWVGETLSKENGKALFIPEGFAHGFCALSDVTVIYHCTDSYAPAEERGILWNDAEIGIDWPIDKPILTERDATYPGLSGAESNFEYPVTQPG